MVYNSPLRQITDFIENGPKRDARGHDRSKVNSRRALAWPVPGSRYLRAAWWRQARLRGWFPSPQVPLLRAQALLRVRGLPQAQALPVRSLPVLRRALRVLVQAQAQGLARSRQVRLQPERAFPQQVLAFRQGRLRRAVRALRLSSRLCS